jgi:hypothetical protein
VKHGRFRKLSKESLLKTPGLARGAGKNLAVMV